MISANNGLMDFFSGMQFSGDALDEICSSFSSKNLERGELFSCEGRVNDNIAFVASGFFQYYLNKDGVEITTYLSGPQSFIASLMGILMHKPAVENIRAITNSEIFVIDKMKFESLREKVPGFNHFYVSMLEYQLICVDESRLGLLTQSAEQRYEAMLQKDPLLLKHLPLQLLATTLGITPRHLSRIRSKIRA